MKCPTDNTTLLITERNGIEIDYCPECRGVWLDRGELDKMIERSSMVAPQSQPYDQPQFKQESRQYDARHEYDTRQPHHKKHRRESFLEDLFDF